MKQNDVRAVFASVKANYPAVRAWVQSERNKYDEYLIRSQALPVVHQAQGRIQMLDEILTMLDFTG